MSLPTSFQPSQPQVVQAAFVFLVPCNEGEGPRLQSELKNLESKLASGVWDRNDRSSVEKLVEQCAAHIKSVCAKNSPHIAELQLICVQKEDMYMGVYEATSLLVQRERGWQETMDVAASIPQNHSLCQSRNQLAPLFEEASLSKVRFDLVLKQTAAEMNIKFDPSPLKHLFRAAEKTQMKTQNVGRADNVFDIVRGIDSIHAG